MWRHSVSIALTLYCIVTRVTFSLIPRYMNAVLFLCAVFVALNE